MVKRKRLTMKSRLTFGLLTLVIAGTLAGCSSTTQSADVADGIRKSLAQGGYKDVSVAQDRDKGIVTLSGHVAAAGDKAQAEQVARTMAVGQVIANEIIVLPPGAESAAKAYNSDVDKAIEKLFDASLIQNNLHDIVKYSAKNGVLTLKGDVNSQAMREQVQNLAAAVPNVQQVVNEMQVTKQKATASN
jgi:hyperosmotically inducible periplasmic protein